MSEKDMFARNDRSKHEALVHHVLENNILLVVSSVWQGEPQSALVAFSFTEKFELIFGTFQEARKYRNIIGQSAVSAVIGWDYEEKKTVQYEGIATELVGAERIEFLKIHFKRLPEAEVYSTMENERYFKVEPKWIRYTDLLAVPELVVELEF